MIRRWLGALTLASIAVPAFAQQVTRPFLGSTDLSTNPTTANNGNTAISFANRFAQVINVRDYGATGNGTTDDSAAIASAITAALAFANGLRPIVYFPAGTYLITGTALPLINKPVTIEGDSTHATYIKVSNAYVGSDVFPVSETWDKSSYVNPFNPTNDFSGTVIRDLMITGDTTASSVQNALHFYDRNDQTLIQNVFVAYLNGACLSIGDTDTQTQAYMRESAIYNLKCYHTGTSSIPAVKFSSTTASGSDATNTLHIYDVNIFASAGPGLVISDPNAFNHTRLLDFHGLRVESSGGDNIDIGLSTDAGYVGQINMDGVINVGPPSGFAALKIATGSANQPYNITVRNMMISTGAGNGIDIENGTGIKIETAEDSVTGTKVITGANVTGPVYLDGHGSESGWTYSLNASSLKWFRTSLWWPQRTVSTLTTCNSTTEGQQYTVTDATSPTYNATMTGGGTSAVLAFCNGTNWVAH